MADHLATQMGFEETTPIRVMSPEDDLFLVGLSAHPMMVSDLDTMYPDDRVTLLDTHSMIINHDDLYGLVSLLDHQFDNSTIRSLGYSADVLSPDALYTDHPAPPLVPQVLLKSLFTSSKRSPFSLKTSSKK